MISIYYQFDIDTDGWHMRMILRIVEIFDTDGFYI
jgi:hypothetical protein